LTPLTETAAERHLRDIALTAGPPGFVGVAADLLLTAPGVPFSLVESLAERPQLRHGFMTARSARVVVVSGPPSPGLDVCVERMTEDIALPRPLIGGHGIAVLDEAADTVAPTSPPELLDAATAGIRVALEAGIEGAGPYGLRHRWAVAQAIAPVLAAAFANSPLSDGRPTGWHSNRLALRRAAFGPAASTRPGFERPVPMPGDDPRAAWAGQVLDAPVGPGHTFRDQIRSGRADFKDLHAHLRDFRPPVAARGHLEIDVADRQPGNGWRVPLAVITALIEDPLAAAEALVATSTLDGDLWTRAARDSLTDPELAAAARSCFVSAYAALARQGVRRELRDAVADFTERYVMRSRCPADDVLDRAAARP
jgi:glutamate--cysteine ligase